MNLAKYNTSDEGSEKGKTNGNDQYPTYHSMSRKQYFMINFAKFTIECYGTFILTMFYLMMGD